MLDGPSSAIPYLLQSSQLGPEYDQKTAGSRPVTSSEMRAGQSPRGLDVVKASWKNGARGSWVQAHGTITVTSEAELFDTSQLGPVSDSIERRMIKLYHGREASSPAALPAGAWFLTGRTISHMISTYPARRQVAVVGWQHGDVLAVVVITGLPHDGVDRHRGQACDHAGRQHRLRRSRRLIRPAAPPGSVNPSHAAQLSESKPIRPAVTRCDDSLQRPPGSPGRAGGATFTETNPVRAAVTVV